MKRRRPTRRGMTLLEVILATAIFVASLAVVSQLFNLGLVAIQAGHRQTLALLRCESKLEEIVSGIAPARSTDDFVPFVDDPAWRYRVLVEPTPHPGLAQVSVDVEHLPGDGLEIDPDAGCSLTRWIAHETPLPGLSAEPIASVLEPIAATAPPLTLPQILGLEGANP